MSFLRKIFFKLSYLTNPPWDTGVTPPELKAFIESNPPGRALDLGCGTGTNAIYMAKHGWGVSAVDFVGRAIDQARKKAKKAGVKVDFRVDDVTRLKGITGPFDLILDIGCFHNLDKEAKEIYIQNLERMLGAGGAYLLYTFLEVGPDQKRGITETDIKGISRFLQLSNRQEGVDRRDRVSAWFTFKR